ncbi:MAG: DUF6603 domain-containing protein, partial [Ginsengibacter sp.]
MSEQQDTIALIGQELLNVISPLKESFSDAERFKGFLYTLGWEANGLPNEYIELAASVTDAEIFIEKIATGTFGASDIPGLIGAVKNLYDKIQGISTAPPGVNAPEFLSEIGKRLFEFLLTSYLQRIRPVYYNLLSAMDVIQIQNIAGSANKHAFIRTEFKWEEIPKIIQDPLSILKRVYGWGGSQLNSQILFEHLSGFLHGLGFPVMLTEINDSVTIAYSGSNPSLSRSMRGIKIPFHYNVIGTTPVELSVEILELPAAAGKLPGIVIQPGLPSVIPLDFDFGEEVTLHIKAGSDIANTFGVIIRPDEFSVKYPFQDGTSFPSAGFEVSFDYHPPEPKLIVGSPGGIRIQEKGFVLGFQVISVSGDFEIKFYMELKELSLILAAGEGDGFLKTLLGDGETKVDIPLGIDWSSKNGFGFRGSGNFEIALNPHLTLGPITISGFQLSLGLPAGADPKIKLEAGININGDLGPLKALVQEIGLGLYLNFKPGNLGPLDLDLGFKPPNGVGLSVDAGVVKGGGYLFFDFDKGEYAGALELTFSGIVSLKAIGIITTKMPDGSDGFSLLIIITAEFGTGIQLGFGFVLLGVGGLLGLNRTMRLQPLAEGVRTGGINGIMFPTDVVANAPRIISDLRNYFPPEEGKFLIGPMAKLGWGTP